MPHDIPPVPVRFRWWRVLGWGLVVALVAAGGWGGWRVHDYRAAVREARAAGLNFSESPTPFVFIRADWHYAFRRVTWLERERQLSLLVGADLATLRPLLLRLNPTHLWVPQCRNVDALRGLTRLHNLSIHDAEANDLAGLTGLTNLKVLDLEGCTSVADLAPLGNLTQLQWLSLRGCTSVADLAPLAGLKQLQELCLDRRTGLSAEAVAAFKKSHPQVVVVGP